MKVSDIITTSDLKVLNVANHVKRKKKSNPKDSKTTTMNTFIDVFGGMSGYDSENDAPTEFGQ